MASTKEKEIGIFLKDNVFVLMLNLYYGIVTENDLYTLNSISHLPAIQHLNNMIDSINLTNERERARQFSVKIRQKYQYWVEEECSK